MNAASDPVTTGSAEHLPNYPQGSRNPIEEFYARGRFFQFHSRDRRELKRIASGLSQYYFLEEILFHRGSMPPPDAGWTDRTWTYHEIANLLGCTQHTTLAIVQDAVNRGIIAKRRERVGSWRFRPLTEYWHRVPPHERLTPAKGGR